MSAPVTRRGALAGLVAGVASAALTQPVGATAAPVPPPVPVPEPHRLDLWGADGDHELLALFAALEIYLLRLDEHVLHRAEWDLLDRAMAWAETYGAAPMAEPCPHCGPDEA
jgi:hypothetical protein